MIRFLMILVLFCGLESCKKIEENVQEKRAMEFITSGEWKVKSLIKNNTNYTNDFVPYVFRFKANGKVEALANGIIAAAGDWEGNTNEATIKSNFSITAVHPLPILNGTWQIADGGDNYTVAKKTENGETSVLRLEKI